MKVLIIGSSGRLGTTLLSLFRSIGIDTYGVDLHNADISRTAMEESDLVFLCVPIGTAKKMIDSLEHSQKFVEVSSVKKPFIEYAGKIISIHPLFGPLSINKEDLRNILFISDISRKGSKKLIEDLFPGFNIIQIRSVDHDRLMVQLQVIPYLLSILSSRISTETALKTRSRIILDHISSIFSSQSPEVLADTIRLNPFSKDAFGSMKRTLEELGGELFDNTPQ
jgi:prephenate dehydrogenase